MNNHVNSLLSTLLAYLASKMKFLNIIKACIIIVMATQNTFASEYGCTVLLCLANPVNNGGPKGLAECVSPINRLYDDLLHGRPFPNCDMSDGNDDTSYAKQVFEYYDHCQRPLSIAPVGSYVVQGTKKITQSKRPLTDANAYQLFGTPRKSESIKGVGGVLNFV